MGGGGKDSFSPSRGETVALSCKISTLSAEGSQKVFGISDISKWVGLKRLVQSIHLQSILLLIFVHMEW